MKLTIILAILFSSTVSMATNVLCHVNTRKSPYQLPSDGRFDHRMLIVPAGDVWQDVRAEGFLFQAKFSLGDAGGQHAPFVKLYVWDEAAPNNHSYEALSEVLFELDATTVPRNTFRDGFTGLQYVYHPKSKAELQYWCEYLP